MTSERSGESPDDRDGTGDESAPDAAENVTKSNGTGFGTSRRALLASTAGAAVLAGCNSLLGGDDDGNGNGEENGNGSENGNGNGVQNDPPETLEEFEVAVTDKVESAQSTIDQGPYDADWESLADVDQEPEWFRDGKFGIYFHWGLYSVPAFDTEWYPKWMYMPDRDGWGEEVHPHHVENYGEPDEFPYEDFAPDFTAEEFDPDDWAQLFADAGARFAGPSAEHHDGWSNWASDLNPYNAGSMGPERDIVGELESAIRDRDMKYVTTLHNGRPTQDMPCCENKYYEGAFERFPSVTQGYPNQVLYRNLDTDLRWNLWFAKLVEVIENYEPDLVWHDDINNPPDDLKQQYLAYNYNRADEQERPIVVTQKEVGGEQSLPLDSSVEDFENDRPSEMMDRAWLSDITLSTGAWSYTEGQEYKSAQRMVHVLSDIVSKNGQMLLNLGPRADGTIPQAQRDRVLEIGEWLDTNGEAIYETRPWGVYGEGPTHDIDSDYTAEDIRYTQSKDGETVYAIVLGWPGSGTLMLGSTHVNGDGEGTVTLLGHDTIPHEIDSAGSVTVEVPDLDEDERPSTAAVAFALEGFDLESTGVNYVIDESDVYIEQVEADSHEITVTVHNDGLKVAPATTVQIENSSADAAIGEASIDPIDPGDSTQVVFEWDTSAFDDGSVQEITVTADPDDEVPIRDAGDKSATTEIELPAYPQNLELAGIDLTDTTPGETAELTITVANVGTVSSEEAVVRLTDVTGGESTLTELAVPTMGEGTNREATYEWDVSGFDVGTTRDVRAVIDPDDELDERSVGNDRTESIRLYEPLGEYDSTASTDALFGRWDGSLVIEAAGADIWNDVDEYGAIYDPDEVAGSETTATVKVASQENTNSWAKAGLMLRNDVAAAGESLGYAALLVTPDNGFELEWDSEGSGYVDDSSNAGETTYPCWLRLERDGTTVTGSYSTDGDSWTEVGSAELQEPADEQDVALFSTSHEEGTLGTSEFDEFDVS